MKEHIRAMMDIASQEFASNPHLTESLEGLNAKGEKSIEMDVRVEEAIVKYLIDSELPVGVFSEESGIIEVHRNPQFLVVVDPLDGSTNYNVGKGLLPFGFLIAIFNGMEPKLNDVIAAGALEQTQKVGWIFDGKSTTDQSGSEVKLNKAWELTKSTPFYLDLYYKEGYEKYSVVPEKLFVRNVGSNIGHLSYVLSEVGAGMGGICMRPEEIGAVYGLIKGAGGTVCNNNGIDIGEELFSAKKTYEFLAGHSGAVEYAASLLRK